MNQTLTLCIIELIESHFPASISINEIAKQCGYSRSYIQHQFKALTGYSISYYQRARILSMAANRLAEGKHRVLDVAIEFGFESQEAFARAFRQHTSATPSCLLGQDVWAERIHFERLDSAKLELHRTLQQLTITTCAQPETRWGCFVFNVDSSQRDIKVIIDAIDNAYQTLISETWADPLDLRRAQILEFRQHYQKATSTYPMSIAIPFAKDASIPEFLFEIRLPACRLAAISLPNPSYVPAIFEHLYRRLYHEQQHYWAGLPSFWDYDYQTTQLHHKCQIEPLSSIDSDPILKLFDKRNETALEGCFVAIKTDSIPHRKRAGTRRISTLLQQLAHLSKETTHLNVVFHNPMERKHSQYHYSLGAFVSDSQELPHSTYEKTIDCQGRYLSTRWRGKDVWQLENQIEQFYWRLSQHRHYQYRVAPEIFWQLSLEDGHIEFELLTPIDYRSGSRKKTIWTI